MLKSVETLSREMRSSNSDTQWNAATELGAIGTPEAVAALMRIFEYPDTQVQRRAVYSLQALNAHEATEVRIGALSSPDDHLCEAAAKTIGEFHAHSAVPALILCLQRENSRVKQTVLDALAKMPDPQSVYPIVALLSDPNHKVREDAAHALGSIGDVRAVDGLLDALDCITSEVRFAAVSALGKLRAKETEARVAEMLTDKCLGTRLSAIRALTAIRADGAEAMWSKDLNHPYPFRRFAATIALATLCSQADVSSVAQALNTDSFYPIRVGAAEALGEIGGASAELALKTGLQDPVKQVRYACLGSLERLNRWDDLSLLEQLMSDRERSIRIRAACILGRVGNDTGIEILTRSIMSGTSSVKIAAAEGLSVEPTGQGAILLSTMLKNDDVEVRDACRDALTTRTYRTRHKNEKTDIATDIRKDDIDTVPSGAADSAADTGADQKYPDKSMPNGSSMSRIVRFIQGKWKLR